MYTGPIVFAQVMDVMPMHEFRKCVRRYHGDYKVRGFTCLDQFLCMIFAQLTYRESLRDIESCLRAMSSRLYHMGIRGRISRSTLADANEKRDWRIYADFAVALIDIARELYRDEPFSVDLQQSVYAFDSTVIELCLSLFPWARFHHGAGGIKLHTLLNLRGSIPEFIHITPGNVNDIAMLDLLLIQPGSFYVIDRGYMDFRRFYALHQSGAFFVTRAKRNLDAHRRYSRPVDKSLGVRSDQTIALVGINSSQYYPDPLRRISYRDPHTGKHLVFLTNNFILAPLTIAKLYKARWQVENFFRWIKQHLRIKAFFGTSQNAVTTQIWTAVCAYVLVAILKKHLRSELPLYTILQVLSVGIFERESLDNLLSQRAADYAENTTALSNQLTLFNL